MKQAIWFARQTKAEIALAYAIPDLQQTMLLVSPDAGTVIYAVDGDRLQRQSYDDSEAELQALVDTFQVRDFSIRCKTFY